MSLRETLTVIPSGVEGVGVTKQSLNNAGCSSQQRVTIWLSSEIAALVSLAREDARVMCNNK